MRHRLGVDALQPLEELLHDGGGILLVVAAQLHHRVQELAAQQQLHDDVCVCLGLVKVVDAHHVFVLKRHGESNLLRYLSHRHALLFFLPQRNVHDLHRVLLLGAQVSRLLHYREPASTKHPAELEVSQHTAADAAGGEIPFGDPDGESFLGQLAEVERARGRLLLQLPARGWAFSQFGHHVVSHLDRPGAAAPHNPQIFLCFFTLSCVAPRCCFSGFKRAAEDGCARVAVQ
mmetsp:Transcript_21866/g.54065  ORF Transcript_21866/g.54065 Transcript_21866/m.54065 type:complete len:232 (-) Transcript_21866:65-760(-)